MGEWNVSELEAAGREAVHRLLPVPPVYSWGRLIEQAWDRWIWEAEERIPDAEEALVALGSGRLNIMHVLGSFGPGGAEMGVVRLVEKMTDPSMRHSVCSIGPNVTMRGCLPRGVGCHALGIEGPSYGVFVSLARLFRRNRVHIAHVNNLGPWLDVLMASSLAGCRCVETFHGIEDDHWVLPLWKRVAYRWAARLSEAVTAVSDAAREKLRSLTGIPLESVRVIANGVDEDVFCPSANLEAVHRVRDDLGLPLRACLFVCVAAYRPVKNHAGLLFAFARAFKKASPEAVGLVLVGSGVDNPEVDEALGMLGLAAHVHRLGHRTDIARILPAMDVFVLNSWTEGLSYAVLEAMACGLPVCATRVGSNPDLIAEGREGFLYRPGDTARLVTILQEFFSMSPNHRRSMGAGARQKVVETYSLRSMVNGYRQLYHSLV